MYKTSHGRHGAWSARPRAAFGARHGLDPFPILRGGGDELAVSLLGPCALSWLRLGCGLPRGLVSFSVWLRLGLLALLGFF